MKREDITREEAIKMLKSKMDGNTDTSYEWAETVRMAIKALEQTMWIPCSERLPEKTGLYLINIGDLVTTANFEGHYFRTQSMVRYIPDAWMPLPQPYKAESEDKHE